MVAPTEIGFCRLAGETLEALARRCLHDSAAAEQVCQESLVEVLPEVFPHEEQLSLQQRTDLVLKKLRNAVDQKLCERALSALANLEKAAPPRVEEHNGVLLVLLEGHRYSVGRLQRALAAKKYEPRLRELHDKGVPLEWLETPTAEDAELLRVPVDQRGLESALAHSAKCARDAAEGLTLNWFRQAGRSEPSEAAVWREKVQAVRRTLTGVAQHIRAKMPRDLRWAGEGVFRIRTTEAGLSGCWSNGTPSLELDIRQVIEEEARLVGGLTDHEAGNLASFLCEQIREGKKVVPGFTVNPPAGNQIDWLWQRAVLEARPV